MTATEPLTTAALTSAVRNVWTVNGAQRAIASAIEADLVRLWQDSYLFPNYRNSDFSVPMTGDQLRVIYSEAYDRGHSAGYSDVENEFIDLTIMVARVLRKN